MFAEFLGEDISFLYYVLHLKIVASWRHDCRTNVQKILIYEKIGAKFVLTTSDI